MVKRLFVFLAIIALVGGPWAQALAQGAMHRCALAEAVTVTVDAGVDQASPCDDMATHEPDAGKSMSAACAQDCLAQVNLVVPAAEFVSERQMRKFEPGIALVVDGRTPEPELSPPITLI